MIYTFVRIDRLKNNDYDIKIRIDEDQDFMVRNYIREVELAEDWYKYNKPISTCCYLLVSKIVPNILDVFDRNEYKIVDCFFKC